MDSIRGTYGAALRVTMRNTAAAYGYTLSTAATLSLLTKMAGRPDAGRLFLFAIGGVIAFVVLEAVLAALGSAAESPEQAFPFAGALNVASVAAAFGMAILVVHLVQSSLAWLVAPMGTTAVYMLVVAVQVTAVAAAKPSVGRIPTSISVDAFGGRHDWLPFRLARVRGTDRAPR